MTEQNELMKIVFKDDKKTKAIRGYIISEDDFFIHVDTTHGFKMWVGKSAIVSIKQEVEK